MKICPIILSGGSGTRLWPISRSLHPKQFLNLSSSSSLMIDTVERVHSSPLETLDPLIICSEHHRFLVAHQMKSAGIQPLGIILEPEGKNTAPAVMLAAAFLELKFPDEDLLMLVLPADHKIENILDFQKAVEITIPYALDRSLCIFGIKPSEPNTGYGYIKAKTNPPTEGPVHLVDEFFEKPKLDKAVEYIQSKDYFWNSGMFMFLKSQFLHGLQLAEPLVSQFCTEAIKKSESDINFLRPDSKTFLKSPSVSIDYGLMEKAKHLGMLVHVTELDVGWSDIGTWSSLYKSLPKDDKRNSKKGEVFTVDSEDSLLHSESGILAAIGLKGMLVVNTKDALLVAPMNQGERVTEIVKKLKDEKNEKNSLHREVHRPWGTYDNIEEDKTFKVKRIRVLPNSQLSLQLHHQRSEHWVVVQGEATVTRGEEILILRKNESTFIPLGVKHSLANNTNKALEIIEVQIGDYLGEDDIVRFKDDYGRADD